MRHAHMEPALLMSAAHRWRASSSEGRGPRSRPCRRITSGQAGHGLPPLMRRPS